LARRYRRRRQGHRPGRSAHPLPETCGPPGAGGRLYRRHPVVERAVRRRDGRRPAARRNHPSQNARASRKRRGRSRGRLALCRGRQRVVLRRRARLYQPLRDRSHPRHARHARQRSDERLLRHAPRPFRRDRGQARTRRFQDPARHRDGGKPPARRRGSLFLRHAPGRRKQVQRAGGSRIFGVAACESQRRHARTPLHLFRAGGHQRPSRASDRAQACARFRAVHPRAGHRHLRRDDEQLPVQQQLHLSRPPPEGRFRARRLFAVLHHRRDRCVCDRRFCVLALFQRTHLVGGRCCGRHHERVLELRDVQPVRVAHAMKIRGRIVLLSVIVLILARFIAAAILPLSADEAYYWLWSRHLDWGYYDHPPLIAYAIRAGTAMFGEIPFGVRLIGLLSSIVASIAVWRAGAIVLKDEKAGGYACLFFNLSLMIAIEAMAATPDALAVATAALFLWALAKVEETGRGAWWLAAGMAAGIGLLAKYTTFFLGAGTLVWLLADKRQRRWF